jgi:hypothetical protein
LSAASIWVNPHDGNAVAGDRQSMSAASYPVTWQEGGAPQVSGRLRVELQAVTFDGRDDRRRRVSRTIEYGELQAVRLLQQGSDLDAGRALLVEIASGEVVIHSSALDAGLLQDLARRIAELKLGARRRAVVVCPLRPGAEAAARELASAGPPFVPEELPLESHEVLVSSGEAIFVFESTTGAVLESIIRVLDVWAAATEWRDLVAGSPRVASVAYAWHRKPTFEGVGLGL